MIGTPYKVVPKGWGRELWLANGPAYCGKLLEFQPGMMGSFHYHQRKLETFYLATGSMLLFLEGPGGEPMPHIMAPGSVVTIQPYQLHGFRNAGDTVAVLFEVSTQHHEDDTVRIRKGNSNDEA